MREDFADDLHRIMHRWGLPEWQLREFLPRILKVLTGVGILIEQNGAYVTTELAEDDATWERAWELLQEEGIAGPEGPAC